MVSQEGQTCVQGQKRQRGHFTDGQFAHRRGAACLLSGEDQSLLIGGNAFLVLREEISTSAVSLTKWRVNCHEKTEIRQSADWFEKRSAY